MNGALESISFTHQLTQQVKRGFAVNTSLDPRDVCTVASDLTPTKQTPGFTKVMAPFRADACRVIQATPNSGSEAREILQSALKPSDRTMRNGVTQQ